MLAIQHDISLHKYNTLAIDSTARYFADIKESDLIPDAVNFAEQNSLNIVVLGEGSNVVLADRVSSLVIHMSNKGRTIVEIDDNDSDSVYITACAGENWHDLVEYCLQHQLYGLENLALIPGSVGAAPIQNIGAYGVELMDVFQSLRGWNCNLKCWQVLSKEDCKFGYRDSIFKGDLKGRFIIGSVTLKLSRNPQVKAGYAALRTALDELGINEPSPQQLADAVKAVRQSKLPDPQQLANSGSFFKNPIIEQSFCDELLKIYPKLVYYPQPDGRIKLAAGWLLEQAGWKGLREGKVGMHQQQALVLINYDGANSKEILAFAESIKRDIKEKFAVDLDMEPSLIES